MLFSSNNRVLIVTDWTKDACGLFCLLSSFCGSLHFLSVPRERLNLHPDVLGCKGRHKPLLLAAGSDVIGAQSGGFDGNLGKQHGFYRRVCFASIFKCKSC